MIAANPGLIVPIGLLFVLFAALGFDEWRRGSRPNVIRRVQIGRLISAALVVEMGLMIVALQLVGPRG